MITLKQKNTLVKKVAMIPIIAEVVIIIWLFTEYIIGSNSVGFSVQSFPVLIWWITSMLLIDALIGVRFRLFGLSIKVVFVIVYGLSLFPDWLGTAVPAPLIFAALACSALWMYIERDALFESADSPFRSLELPTNNYIYGKWFSEGSPFAPLEKGGYFYEKQIPYMDRVCQISAEAKNKCSIYSHRVETIGEYMVFGVLAAINGEFIFFISQEPKEGVIIYNCIGVIILIILLISVKVIFFKDIDQQVSLIQSSLCDCLDSAVLLDTLISQKTALLTNHTGLTIAAWGEAITTQINTIVDALSLFSKDLDTLSLMSLESIPKVRGLTQIDTLNTILNEELLEKTQLIRIYVKETIGKYKEALKLYTKELPISESVAGEIANIRLGEIIRSFEAIHIEPMSRIQS